MALPVLMSSVCWTPRRKLGWEPGRRERLASLRALLRWTDKHQRENMVEIRCLLAPYEAEAVEEPPREKAL